MTAILSLLAFAGSVLLLNRGVIVFGLHKELLIFDFTVAFLLGHDFYSRWLPSSKITALAKMCHISKHFLLIMIAVLLGMAALLAIDLVTSSFLRSIFKTSQSHLWKRKGLFLAFFFILEYLSVEYSVNGSLSIILRKTPDALVANVCLIVIVNIVFLLLLQKWKATLIASAVLFSLWSIANYYTVKFHGSPLYLSELVNARTAAAVAFQYRYQLSSEVICVVLLFVLELNLAHEKERFSVDTSCSLLKRLAIRVIILVLVGVSLIPLYGVAVKKHRPWMPWNMAVEKCGFLICTAEDVERRANPIFKPETYSGLEEFPLQQNPAKVQSEYPDIILILNETFCDLSHYAALDLDRDPLGSFYDIKDAVYGYAVAPGIGGGTNNSEFELLTCKSMYLLKSMAPFTFLEPELLSRNAVNYLEEMGYSTAGMHCASGENYSRNTGYPAIGFDSVFLGQEQFSYFGKNGNRVWLDADNYQDMIDRYEELEKNPRFVYLLTFQNHGGYEQNESGFDTIHVQNDFGSLTDDLNEYLSSVELSAIAFRELTEYFKQTERRVILCMVGDHAPSFISDIPSKQELSFEETEIAKRLVPYVIWTNYSAEVEVNTEYASMVDLVPMLMSIAGIQRAVFYQSILDLHDNYPIRTSNGILMDQEKQVFVYDGNGDLFEQLTEYYNLEYNSFLNSEEYRSDLFEIG